MTPPVESTRMAALSRERAQRWAMARTLRDLRISVRRRRPISLPNVLRLLQRRLAVVGDEGDRHYAVRSLERFYREQQRQWMRRDVSIVTQTDK